MSANKIKTDKLGYVYVLANSAMPGLVKIGKTTRNPSERATELSRATGLPTPFIVVYEQLFIDCSSAETFVHSFLFQKGFKLSKNREFFNAPVNDVIRAIALTHGAIDSDSQENEGGAENDLLQEDEEAEGGTYIWTSVFEEAENYYYGIGDYLQDYDEALRLYRQAAKLGSLPAYGKIGEIHKRGEGVPADQKKAIKYYKVGAAKGSVYCYWAMGVLFLDEGNQENAEKCFSNFLKSYPSFTDEKHLTSLQQSSIFMEAGFLINRKLKYGLKYPTILDTFFSGERTESILHHANLNLKDYRTTNDLNRENDFKKVIDYLHSLQGIATGTTPEPDNPDTPQPKRGFFARLFS
ncbi:Sel1 repeat-containing protein [Nitrosospira sp. Nsp2]|uniref:GIY-YIG nuclease family protein n=1 Tax=Nitrosospira sp. Nsp2 TaxID=136548 RepID=UPI000D30E030|nr:GIY-YIG nuclease family protein [Nitrosospira sp. Nsp2]PTR17234.1 Sel1 repeat-containing protein [Nitrosospira sp. Nsp2]